MQLARSSAVSQVRFPPWIPPPPLHCRPVGEALLLTWCAPRRIPAEAEWLREAPRRTPSICLAASKPCPAYRKPRRNRTWLGLPRATPLPQPQNRLAAKARRPACNARPLAADQVFPRFETPRSPPEACL